MPTLLVLDSVMGVIEKELAAFEPERGGALLGPPGWPIVTALVLDPDARTTSVAYNPSQRLFEAIPTIERSQGLECKGIIHSHPGTYDHPSGPDREQVAVALRENPHLAMFLVPIVTCVRRDVPLEDHEVYLLRGKVSFFAGHRTLTREVIVSPMNVSVLPLRRDLERVAEVLGSTASPTMGVNHFEGGVPMPSGTLQLDGVELVVMVSELYPAIPPVVLLTPDGGDTEQLPISWDLMTPASERLANALSPFISGPGPYFVGFGPGRCSPLTTSAAVAAAAGWIRRVTAEPAHVASQAVQSGLLARSAPFVGESLSSKRVLIIGVGSVGSFAAEQIARAAVGAIALIDGDTVELANLSRSVFAAGDVGTTKVDATAKRLLNINPLVEVRTVGSRVQDMDPAQLTELVEWSSVVIAATDDPDAQKVVNHIAYSTNRPAVFVGLYAGARGGEVILSVPETTPCYLCATFMRHAAAEADNAVSRDMDYGTGRLAGEVALAVDVHHVTTVAVKLALALLLRDDRRSGLSDFLQRPLAAGQSYLTIAMDADFWFYPDIFGDTPGQYAFQSVWLRPERRTECIVCGASDFREAPELRTRGVPSSDAFRSHRQRRGA